MVSRGSHLQCKASAVALAALFVLFLSASGCGGGWTSVPIDSINEQTESLGSDRVKLTLQDGRVFELVVSRVEFPYMWGDRFLGTNMPLKPMRIDLREVSRIEVKRL
jgi:hypothetical protein